MSPIDLPASYVLNRALASIHRLRPIGKNVLTTTGNYLAPATDISASGQVRYVTVGSVNRVAVGFHACTTTSGGSEGTLSFPQITRASIEYPLGTTPIPLTVGGRSEWVMDSKTLEVVSDYLGLAMPAGASYNLHIHRRIAYAPLSPALAAAASGGNLAPSTTYFYKVTCVDNGIESGPSAEVSGATGASGTLSLPLSWTANPYVDASPGTSYYNIYRSTTTGTEVLYDSVPARRKNYLDIGSGQQSTGVTPPAASRLQVDRYASANETGNTVTYGGDGSDQTGVAGATTGGTPISGPRAAYIVTPTYVLGDDPNRCVVGLFDSIGSGTGISTSLAGTVGRTLANWFDVGLPAANWNTINLGVGSTSLFNLLNNVQKGQWRLLMCGKGDYLGCNLGFNDFVSLSRTWQQLAADHLTLGRMAYNSGGRYVIVNVPPCNTTTDNLLTTANQVQRSQADRVNYNNWLRGGCLVDGTGAPVLSGGTRSPYVYASFDLASTLEVNAANALTQDGGYWRVPTTPAFNNVVLTGVPTTTSLAVGSSLFSTSSSIVQGLVGYAVKIQTGAAAGQVAFVSASTNTTLTLLPSGDTSFSGVGVQGLSIAPAAGDTFQVIYGYGVDGAHMTMQQNALTATAFTAFAATSLPAF